MVLTIHTHPDPVLRQTAQPVDPTNPQVAQTVRNMTETLIQANGLGLAAPQVGLSWTLFLMLTEEKEILPIINPCILETGGSETAEEGCLSVPEIFAKVKRHKKITLISDTLQGETKTYVLEGLPARIAQHECDHLAGVLFIDRLNPISKMLLAKKIKKLESRL